MRALLVVLALTSGLALAGELTERQKSELEAVRPLLLQPIDVEVAKAVRKALPGFEDAELLELETRAEFQALPEREQRRLLHAVRAVTFASRHEKDVADAWPAAILLGSPDWHDCIEGVRLLQRQEPGDGLERVAVELSRDPRPQARAGAGRLAKILTLLRGPTPACTEIAKRLLADECPNVVMMFAVFDAQDFRDREVTDVVINCLRDTRPLQEIPGMTPWGTEMTVTTAIASRLRGEIDRWTTGKPKTRVLREWWKENRARYDYGPNPDEWRLLGEWKGTCRKCEEMGVAFPEGGLRFAILDYKEYYLTARPVNDLTMSFWRAGEDPAKAGSTCVKAREDGWVSFKTLGLIADRWRVEHLVVPDREGGFRVALRVWKGR